jgi:hypothetical protein
MRAAAEVCEQRGHDLGERQPSNATIDRPCLKCSSRRRQTAVLTGQGPEIVAEPASGVTTAAPSMP